MQLEKNLFEELFEARKSLTYTRIPSKLRQLAPN